MSDGKLLAMSVCLSLSLLRAEPVPVRHSQGLLRGFLALRAQDGALLARGELSQTAKGTQVTNVLRFQFKDGSVHQETTLFSQQRTFRLISYHLIQKGAAFKRPTELRLNARTGQVNIRYTDDDGKEKTIEERLKVPADAANGLVPTLLSNLDPKAVKTTVSMVVSTPKPRIVKMELSPAGEDTFTVAGAPHKAARYLGKIEIGGISGMMAPLIGKQPPDTHFWLIGGTAPGFLASEGALCDGCPVWRIELNSPEWPSPSQTNRE
jgi:hypothetical protein